MRICKQCGEQVDELVNVKAGARTLKLCEDCAELAREDEAVAEESEAVVQKMMDFKGRR
jgi:ribosome-binding protein aMBF1 (putative translation factor)